MHGSESRQQKMLKEEQKLKQIMIEQYYKYLSLLRITNNFEKCLQTYQNINFSLYSASIAVVGRITEITMTSEREQEYCFPLLLTTVNKNIFEQQQTPFSKRAFLSIMRKFIILGSTYKKKLIIPLNKVISTGKKNKEQLFIFTHLQLILKDQKQLCLAFTDHSFIMQLDQHFYSSIFKNIELSLTSTYADLSLTQIFSEGQLAKGSTFVVQDIRTKIHESSNNFSVLGVLKSINWISMQKAVNAKEKEVSLQIIQDSFHRNYKAVGICRIFVRFDILDQGDLVKHLKQGCVYLFLVSQVLLSDNMILNLKLNFWRKNFIRITESPIAMKSMDELYHAMQLSPISYFTSPSIFRNHYKFRVIKYELKLLYAKLTCEKCETAIFRCSDYQYQCRNECGKVAACLRLWAIVGVMDESCYGQLSMEDQAVLDYFDITPEQALQFKEEVAKQEQEGKSGVTLYFKKTKEEFNDDQPNQCIAHDKNPFLAGLIQRFLIKVVHKTVVGTGKINTNESFYSFDEETKHQALASFAKSKEFFKKAKVFVNGILRTFEGRGRLIPYIKVERVLG